MSRVARLPALMLALVLVGVLLWPGAAAAQSGLAADVRGAEVLVVGAPGLRWSDVDPAVMPTLAALAGRSAVGALSVKALPAVSCPADGWLTLGAGARAEAFGVPCGELEGDRASLRARNLETRDQADVDALTEVVREAGGCLSARGPGAGLAGGQPVPTATGANQGGAGAGSDCAALLLDASVVGGQGPARAQAATAVDAVVAAVDAVRDDGSTLVVVGLSGAPTDAGPRLHVALAAGPSFAPGALTSASTRRPPYVQLVDVAPTVLAGLGLPQPPSMDGQPWQSTGPAPTVAELADLDTRAVEARAATVPFFVILLAVLLLGWAAAAARRSWGAAEVVGLAGVAALGGSLLAGLAPWWRAPLPLPALLGVTAGVAAVVVVGCRRVPGTVGPAGAVCGLLAALFVVDLLTGGYLQLDSPAGYSALVAGRFAGLGNVGFGMYAGAVLLALAAATHRRPAGPVRVVVAVGGAVAVLVLGAPPFGSDVGGVLALVPALALLALLRTGARVSALRLLGAGLAGALLMSAFALADFARDPADRTHLGRFVQQIVDGTAGTVLRRKAEAVVDLLFANPVTATLPVVVGVAVLLVVRPPAPLRRAFAAAPAWRHGLLAVGAASVVGFASNDSGPAIPALAIAVAAPATVAVMARTARSDMARRRQQQPADP